MMRRHFPIGAMLLALLGPAPAAQAQTRDNSWAFCFIQAGADPYQYHYISATNVFRPDLSGVGNGWFDDRGYVNRDKLLEAPILQKLVSAASPPPDLARTDVSKSCQVFARKEEADASLANWRNSSPKVTGRPVAMVSVPSPYKYRGDGTTAPVEPRQPPKNYGITVRQPDAPAKPAAVKPAARPAPKPAAKPKLPPKLTPCGGRGQRPCKVKAE